MQQTPDGTLEHMLIAIAKLALQPQADPGRRNIRSVPGAIALQCGDAERQSRLRAVGGSAQRGQCLDRELQRLAVIGGAEGDSGMVTASR